MNFKEYITSILYVAIFGIVLELFLPNTKLKKYVSGFISLLIVITIISPIFNVLKSDKLEEVLDQALLAISNNTAAANENSDVDFSKYMNTTIISRVKENLEQELYTSFSNKLKSITEVKNVVVELDEKYHVKEVVVYITEGEVNLVKLVLDKIISDYEIPSDMLKIVVGGE